VPGGGGISVRNASLILRRGAGSTCEVSNNETGRWASGGIYAEATSEGAMAGFPNLWHAILASVFQFSVMNVAVRGGARVHHNRAMHAGAGDRTGLPRGKGGGLYLIRGDIIDLADLHVRIRFRPLGHRQRRPCRGSRPDHVGRSRGGGCGGGRRRFCDTPRRYTIPI
jgi:hypothetical protein